MSATTIAPACERCGRTGWELNRSDGRLLCIRCYGNQPSAQLAEAEIIAIDAAADRSKRHGVNREPRVDKYAGRILDVAAMMSQPVEDLPWRCGGLVADGFLTVLAGRGGEGKSWLALALACGVARGESAAGIACSGGRALIFDAENGARLIARRFHAAGVTAGMAVQPVEAGGLKVTTDLGWFRKVITDQRAQLVVFDSLRVLASGLKESDSDAMEPVLTALKQLARDTGAAVVLIHHRGKSELNDYRGSSVILDQCDLLFTLGRVAGDPEGRHRRKLTTVKCRIDEEPAPRWLSIEADPSRGLVTINGAEPYDDEDDEPERPRDGLRASVLARLSLEPQSAAAIALSVGRGKNDGTIRRVLDDLLADGQAAKTASGWGLPGCQPLGSGNPGNPSGCRCNKPLAAPTEDGDLRCARCKGLVDGWPR